MMDRASMKERKSFRALGYAQCHAKILHIVKRIYAEDLTRPTHSDQTASDGGSIMTARTGRLESRGLCRVSQETSGLLDRTQSRYVSKNFWSMRRSDGLGQLSPIAYSLLPH
jgi:hypothetical protein